MLRAPGAAEPSRKRANRTVIDLRRIILNTLLQFQLNYVILFSSCLTRGISTVMWSNFMRTDATLLKISNSSRRNLKPGKSFLYSSDDCLSIWIGLRRNTLTKRQTDASLHGFLIQTSSFGAAIILEVGDPFVKLLTRGYHYKEALLIYLKNDVIQTLKSDWWRTPNISEKSNLCCKSITGIDHL